MSPDVDLRDDFLLGCGELDSLGFGEESPARRIGAKGAGAGGCE